MNWFFRGISKKDGLYNSNQHLQLFTTVYCVMKNKDKYINARSRGYIFMTEAYCKVSPLILPLVEIGWGGRETGTFRERTSALGRP